MFGFCKFQFVAVSLGVVKKCEREYSGNTRYCIRTWHPSGPLVILVSYVHRSKTNLLSPVMYGVRIQFENFLKVPSFDA